jgi:hypothetical protein
MGQLRLIMAKMSHKNLSSWQGSKWKNPITMLQHLERLLKEFGIEIRTKESLTGILGGVLLWIISESLRHRFFAAFNEWQDNHEDKAMECLGKLGLWVLDHPYVWLILVVGAILIHVYWKS